jgi:hypothetical protein
VAVTVIFEVPTGVDAPTLTIIVEEPDPGAAIDVGVKLAVAPVGRPDADNEIAELKPFAIVVDIVEFSEPPCAIESDVGDAPTEKLGLFVGLNLISSTGCSSIPFGATPV